LVQDAWRKSSFSILFGDLLRELETHVANCRMAFACLLPTSFQKKVTVSIALIDLINSAFGMIKQGMQAQRSKRIECDHFNTKQWGEE